MSYIAAGNTTTTSLVSYGDTTGNLVFTTGGANATAVNIDLNGRITLPKQPRFFASASGSQQNIASGGSATINYGTVSFDTTSSYNATTSTYTAPITGVYQFNVRSRIDGISGSGNYANLNLVTPFKTFITIYSAAASYTTAQISCLVSMTAGDTAYVTINSQGQTVNTVPSQPGYSDFSGFLVG